MAAGRLAATSVYPVKSAAGVTLDACRVEAPRARRRPEGGLYFVQNLIPRSFGTVRTGAPVETLT